MGEDPLRLRGAVVDGKYEIADFIQMRGSRLVYRALHRIWAEPVALVFHYDDPATPPDQQELARRGFLRAGAIMARLSSHSSGFVQTRDAGLTVTPSGTLAYNVYEWIDGAPLSSVLAQVRSTGRPACLSLDAIMEWFEESVRALQIAHAEGVIHGHIEPSNVFVVGGTFTPRSRLKLRGFTDAAWRVGVPGGASHPAEVDALHAAPELEADDPTLLGPWTDVYGVARIFLELLIGRRPPPGLASSAPGLLVAQEIESALDRALAPRPEDRFRALDTFLTTLNRALHDPQDKVRGPSPRRTMVVSEHVTSEVAGSVGSFEVEPEDDTPVAVEPEVDAPRARVRFAHTQRVLASPSPVTLKRAPMVGRTVPVLPPPRAQSPPRAQTPPNGSPGPYESGVYVKNGLNLTRVGSRAWPYALGGVLVALMTVYLLLMLNTR